MAGRRHAADAQRPGEPLPGDPRRSGSGESSLARAGLVAALERGAIDGSGDWPIVILKPGRDPIESLAVAMAGLDGTRPSPVAVQGLMAALCSAESTLHLTARLALRDGAPVAPAGRAGGPVRGGLHALRGRGGSTRPSSTTCSMRRRSRTARRSWC